MPPPPGSASQLFPNLGQATLLTFGGFALQAALGIMIAGFGSLFTGNAESGLRLVLNPWTLAVVNSAETMLLIQLALRATRETVPQFYAIRPFAPSLFLPIVATALGCGIVLAEIDNVIVDLLGHLPGIKEDLTLVLDLAGNPLGAFLALVIVAPLTEEYLFRGLILRGLLTRHRTVAAILATSILFGVMHGNVRQLFLAIVIGAVFAWWYVRTRSIGPGIIGHAVFNFVPWLVAAHPELVPDYWRQLPGQPLVHQPPLMTLTGALLAGVGLWWFHRQAGTPQPLPLPAAAAPDPLPSPLEVSANEPPLLPPAATQPADSPASPAS